MRARGVGTPEIVACRCFFQDVDIKIDLRMTWEQCEREGVDNDFK